jgi:hypothetical protein
MAKTFFKKKNKRADSVRKRGVLNKGGIGRNVFNKKSPAIRHGFFCDHILYFILSSGGKQQFDFSPTPCPSLLLIQNIDMNGHISLFIF